MFEINRRAVDQYEQLIQAADIQCGWQRTSAVLAAQSEKDRDPEAGKSRVNAIGAQLANPRHGIFPLSSRMKWS
ncbi:MAG: hypothetical protein ACLSA6_14975 [Holdemania massiliensis]